VNSLSLSLFFFFFFGFGKNDKKNEIITTVHIIITHNNGWRILNKNALSRMESDLMKNDAT
jgi:hypothetical protein